MSIPKEIVEKIKAQARAEMPLEACGLLSGKEDRIEAIYPMVNIDQSPEHFSLDPAEQLAVIKQARTRRQQILAVYHSHPATPARMSDEDIRLAWDPNVLFIIFSVAEAKLKAFRVVENQSREETLEITA